MAALTLKLEPVIQLTDDHFFTFVRSMATGETVLPGFWLDLQ
jgi:hypothetical protein